MDATLPLMEQVYRGLDAGCRALERERLTAALEEASNEFRRYSKRFAAGAQKETAAIFDLYLTPAFGCPAAPRAVSPRWIKARWPSGPVKNGH